jgi:hypothetical protein
MQSTHHTFMNAFATIALLFLLGSVTVSPAQTDPVVDDLNLHRQELQRLGLEAFVVACRGSNWPSPWMPSKWRCNSIRDQRELLRVEASRALGLELIAQIEIKADDARSQKEPAQAASASRFWFELADWCAATTGYGNLLLARRCADIASVPLSHLVANESVDAATLGSFDKWLQQPWDLPEVRRKILNDEAQAEVFPLAKDQQKMLTDIWAKGLGLLFDQALPGERKRAPASFLHEPQVSVSVLPAQGLRFFRDEDSAAPPTTGARWDVKQHGLILVDGVQLANLRRIKPLLAYRKVLGKFPQEPYKQSAFYPGLEGAFDEEWRAIAARHADFPEQTGHAAWSAYADIKKGWFVDYEYQLKHPRRIDETN